MKASAMSPGIAADDPRVDPAPYRAKHGLAHRGARRELLRAGVEARERAGEHQRCERRVLEQEAPVALDEVEHRGERLPGLAGGLQLLAERFEAGEEQRPQDARLVPEELVDGGGGGVGLAGQAAGREHVETLACEQPQRGLEHLLGELCGAQLGAWHERMVERERDQNNVSIRCSAWRVAADSMGRRRQE